MHYHLLFLKCSEIALSAPTKQIVVPQKHTLGDGDFIVVLTY